MPATWTPFDSGPSLDKENTSCSPATNDDLNFLKLVKENGDASVSLNNSQEKGVQKKEYRNGEKWKEIKETLGKPEIYFTDVVLLCWKSVSPKKEN